MSVLMVPVALTALALIGAEMPLHALLCACMGATLVEILKRAKKRGEKIS